MSKKSGIRRFPGPAGKRTPAPRPDLPPGAIELSVQDATTIRTHLAVTREIEGRMRQEQIIAELNMRAHSEVIRYLILEHYGVDVNQGRWNLDTDKGIISPQTDPANAANIAAAQAAEQQGAADVTALFSEPVESAESPVTAEA